MFVVVVCSSKFETTRMREERMVLAGQRRREWVGVVRGGAREWWEWWVLRTNLSESVVANS